MTNEEIILKIGVEGGDLTLYGARTGQKWSFTLQVYDCSMLFLDEEEQEPPICRRSPCVASWAEAMALLDEHPWAEYCPVEVHPEFRQKVWREVQRRIRAGGRHNRHRLEWWRIKCGEIDPRHRRKAPAK